MGALFIFCTSAPLLTAQLRRFGHMGRIYQECELAPLGSLYSDFQIALAHSFLKLFTNCVFQNKEDCLASHASQKKNLNLNLKIGKFFKKFEIFPLR